jgi:hypothetical protein
LIIYTRASVNSKNETVEEKRKDEKETMHFRFKMKQYILFQEVNEKWINL